MEKTETIEQVLLPVALDISTAKAVASDLASKRGSPIKIDAGQVSRVGGLGFQVLLAAQRAWKAEGVSIEIINRSEGFERDISLLGNPLETES